MPARTRRPLVAGNWKMNGLHGSLPELTAMIAGAANASGVDLLVCPPATLLAAFASAAKGSALRVGAQDCHAQPSGAFTGDLSAEMLKDAGASAIIVGHSERRQYHRESDAEVKAKAEAVARAGLTAIVCVGETREEREAGGTLSRIERQLDHSLPSQIAAETLVIAYEPVWAIGTGLTPSPDDVAEVHGFIRKHLRKSHATQADAVRLLYGGSVKPDNAATLLAVADVDGALVGGASLKAGDFLGIAAGCR